MKIFLNKNTHVGTDEPADKTKTWLPQNLIEEANFWSNPATYGVLSGPRVKIAEGLDAQNIDAYGEKLRVYEVEPSTLVIKEYKNGAWVNMDLNIDVPEAEDELAGTWVFVDSPDFTDLNSLQGNADEWEYAFNCNGVWVSNDNMEFSTFRLRKNQWLQQDAYEIDFNYFKVYNSKTAPDWTYGKVFAITSKLAEVTNGEALLTWLKANATKQ